MSTLSAKDERNNIIQAISKRSQTKFAKLFYEFDKNPTQTNMVLLLQELSEQKDFYVDFNISLKYFLDLYEQLAASSKTFLFNEAGLLVYNATKIYDRRLDCVLQRLEDQLTSLSNSLEIKQNNSNEKEQPSKEVVEKPTKKRKRLVESTQDPFEFEWTKRKFKKLTENKRFGPGTKIDRTKLIAQKLHAENYLHPALWKYSEIVDLENEEEIDSKRNYRLFTSYVEHRYNTLVPDINFRLYYKMKDYLDAEDDRYNDEHINNSWPPLSQAFVKQYLKMEDRALAHIQTSRKRKCTECPGIANETNKKNVNTEKEVLPCDSGISLSGETTETGNKSSNENCVNNLEVGNVNKDINAITSGSNEALAESGLGISIEDSATLNNTAEKTNQMTTPSLEASTDNNEQTNSVLNLTQSMDNEKSDLGESLLAEVASSTAVNSTQLEAANVSNQTSEVISNDNLETEHTDNQAVLPSKNNNEAECTTAINAPDKQTSDNTANTAKNTIEMNECDNKIDDIDKETVEVTVHIETGVSIDQIDYPAQLSPQNDEGVCFSDLDDAPLTPITIRVEKCALGGVEKTSESVNLNNLEEIQLPPSYRTSSVFWPIKLNIFKFPNEIIKKMRRPKLLNLGDEMELYLKSRLYKRARGANESSTIRQIRSIGRSASSASYLYVTPPASPCSSVFLGFGEEGESCTRPIQSTDEIESGNMKSNNAMPPLRVGEHSQRLSRDSGVGNDLTATPEKITEFFPSIAEAGNENNETNVRVGRNLFGVEILENTLLQTAFSETLTENSETPHEKNDKPQENLENSKETAETNTDPDINKKVLSEAALVPEVNEKLAESTQTNAESLLQDVDSALDVKLASNEVLNEETEKFAKVSNENLSIGKDAMAASSTAHDATEIDNFIDFTNMDHNESFIDADTIANDDQHVELCDDIVAKIQKWHRTLQPILAKSRERHHFDVFQIGTNILNEFNKKPNTDSITFQDVMQHQDPSYVSRFFLSSLLLANQGNIALNVTNKCNDKPTEWWEVDFKLLSTTRHVVAVEDNIGMLPTKTAKPVAEMLKSRSAKKATSPELLPPPPPAMTNTNRKRKLSTVAGAAAVAVAANVQNVNLIGTIKPIGKTPRLSEEDSGIASLESEQFDLTSSL